MRKVILSSLILFITSLSFGQLGGKHTYVFMDVANSARLSSLGSNFTSVQDDDLSLVYSNPSLINPEMSGLFTLSYIDYMSDVKSGFAAYAFDIDKVGTIAATLQFMHYGTFQETNNLGVELGEFTAAEYALTIGWSKKLGEQFDVGANFKPIYSSLESYSSFGLATDVAVTYKSKDDLLSTSLIVANIGRQITTYTSADREPIGFDVKYALSKKFAHAPLRFHILLNQLHRWDVTYGEPELEPEVDQFTGEEIPVNTFLLDLDNAARHVVLAAEFVPGKGNFALRVGYNYKRRKEMAIADRRALVGLSFGFGLKVSKFHISYARSTYSLAGGSNHFTISTRFADFLK